MGARKLRRNGHMLASPTCSVSSEAADALMSLTRIISWHFAPQESEVVMCAEFSRILERVDIEFWRRNAQLQRTSGRCTTTLTGVHTAALAGSPVHPRGVLLKASANDPIASI